MECKASGEKCFTFLWKLENISYCLQKKGQPIESPAFVVNEIEKTKWKLWLYPRGSGDGNYIGYFLGREADSDGPDEIEIKSEFAFIAKDGSFLISHSISEDTFERSIISIDTFERGVQSGYDQFQEREEVYVSERSTFLPQDTLTALCRIWKTNGEMSEDVRCTALTRFGIERRSFLWELENFSTIEAEKKYNFQLKSVENNAAVMSIDMSLSGGLNFEEIIIFDLSPQDENIKFCTLQLFLIDNSGKKVECNQQEFWFEGLNNYKQFPFYFTKKKLMANKNFYLPNDALSLQWEFTFSQDVVLEKIEETQYGSACSKNEFPDALKVNEENRMSPSGVYSLIENLKSMHDQQFLCDVNLKTSTSTFPAHKLILSASSSVFSAMFSNDMKEKDNNYVNIEDLSDDTIRRMLLYMYTSRMDDITWVSASNLYAAADKYAIFSLKNICCSYLKENLSPSNACELLLLADLHADEDLKSAVQDFILKHDKIVINSDEWKLLMDTNAKLAAETLCLRYK